MGTYNDINPNPLDMTGWSTIFFDGFNGTELDRNEWPITYGGSMYWNNAFWWDNGQLSVGDGALTIGMDKADNGIWTVGGLTTMPWKGAPEGLGTTFQFGRVEIRAKTSVEVEGAGPCFLLWPANDTWPPEIDILETPKGGQGMFTVHYPGPDGGPEGRGYDSQFFDLDHSQWHTYTLDWLPDRLTLYVDGVKVAETFENIPQIPMSVGLQGHVGIESDGWYGSPNDTGVDSVDIEVDWVRVSQYTGETPPPSPPPSPAPPPAPTPAPEPMPAPEPQPAPEPEPAPAPQPEPEPAPAPQPEPAPAPAPEPTPAPTPTPPPAPVPQQGTSGSDKLTGTAAADLLDGGAGHDRLLGRGGDDILRGGEGRDRLFGGAGNDLLDGGPGNDTLRGGPGDDRITTGTGSDTVLLGNGDGDDHVTDFAPDADSIRLAGGLEAEEVTAGLATRDGTAGLLLTLPGGETLFLAGLGLLTAEELGLDGAFALAEAPPAPALPAPPATAAPTATTVEGTAGDDWLKGGEGADLLLGGAGSDDLQGGAGDDVLRGGADHDGLTGGAGRDSFVLARGDANDWVVDFTPGEDLIRLEGFGLGFADLVQRSEPRWEYQGLVLDLGQGDEIYLQGITTPLQPSDIVFA